MDRPEGREKAMARVVDALPRSRAGGGAGPIYPWDEWLDGRVWELTAGEDFTIRIDSMRSSASSFSRKIGRTVRTRVNADKTLLFVQALPLSPDGDPSKGA